MSTFMPITIRIDGRRILFVGGGATAMHKLQTVLGFTRELTLLAPELDSEVAALGLRHIQKVYESSDLEGCLLVYACSGDAELDRRVLADAQERGILCNIVDNRNDSDFISPAVFLHDGMCVAVSSDGRQARRSVEWRNKIRGLFRKDDASPVSTTP